MEAAASTPVLELQRRVRPAEGRRAEDRRRRLAHLGWLVPMLVQVAHALAIAPTYHVGSFDDDGNYLMAAHVLASGGWLTTTMPSGASVAANYLPGYPALLVPVVWLTGHSLVAPRVLSALCTAAVYPLVWYWLGRLRVSRWVRGGALLVLALSPVLATYATMVMAEAPFVLVFVLALLALDLWETSGSPWWGAVGIVLAVYLVWLKEAGIGLLGGLVLYMLWRRRWRWALGAIVGGGALLAPGLAARLSGGSSLIGQRYTGEISGNRQGAGIVGHWISEARGNAISYVVDTLHQTLLPPAAPWQHVSIVHALVLVVWWTAPVLCVLGVVSLYRSGSGAAVWMVGAYLLETLVYPYNNQRRLVLVLPVIAVWYAMGAASVFRWAVRALSSRRGAAGSGRDRLNPGRPHPVRSDPGRARLGRPVLAVGLVGSCFASVGVLAPAAAHFGDNYLFVQGAHSSVFAGSPAIGLLRDLGRPSSVVETDYQGSVAYFTGHRTDWDAFTRTTPYGPTAASHKGSCTLRTVAPALREDKAAFLLVGDLNIPGLDDSPCLLSMATKASTAPRIGAVRLLSVPLDNSSVFELIGPGSAQPGLRDFTGSVPVTGWGAPAATVRLAPNGVGDAGGRAYQAGARAGLATFTWAFGQARVVRQLTVGSVTGTDGAVVTGATVSVELPGGVWRTVATSRGPVTQGGARPYLVAHLSPAQKLTAVRLTAAAHGTVRVAYVNAIGPA